MGAEERATPLALIGTKNLIPAVIQTTQFCHLIISTAKDEL